MPSRPSFLWPYSLIYSFFLIFSFHSSYVPFFPTFLFLPPLFLLRLFHTFLYLFFTCSLVLTILIFFLPFLHFLSLLFLLIYASTSSSSLPCSLALSFSSFSPFHAFPSLTFHSVPILIFPFPCSLPFSPSSSFSPSFLSLHSPSSPFLSSSFFSHVHSLSQPHPDNHSTVILPSLFPFLLFSSSFPSFHCSNLTLRPFPHTTFPSLSFPPFLLPHRCSLVSRFLLTFVPSSFS